PGEVYMLNWIRNLIASAGGISAKPEVADVSALADKKAKPEFFDYYLNDPSNSIPVQVRLPQEQNLLPYSVHGYVGIQPIKHRKKHRAANCHVCVGRTIEQIQGYITQFSRP